MSNDPTNGGKRINNLERKDAVHDTLLDMLVKQSKSTHDMVERALPQIIRNEERICSNRSWIKALWTIAAGLLGLGIKVAFF